MTQIDLKQQTRDAIAKLHTLADDIRVRIHLGEMDLKETWKEYEPQFTKLEKSAHHASQELVTSLQALIVKFEECIARLAEKELPSRH